MRFFLSVILTVLCCGPLFSQRPRLFTERLGNHPQFPFLQFEKGITTRALFLKAVKDPESRSRYKTEFAVFNRLLRDIGFAKGYKDVRADQIENVFINPGTIGRLGFFNKESNYIYVKLNPAGEGDDGIAAWKITGPHGRYIHILHTCGNAFFIDGANIPCPIAEKPAADTVYKQDSAGRKDTVYKKDTVYIRIADSGRIVCHKKWEVTVDGGASFNSVPRFDNVTQHSRTDGARPTVEVSVSRIFNHWLQAGLLAAYRTLAYQDDLSGAVPHTWNEVYPAKPMIPLQLFGKATIGGPLGWQANTSLSAGFGWVARGTAKSGFTAGLKMGVAYFFNCRWGLGGSFEGQYFSNKLFALPITAGVRYRF
ncbi:hypothetical protein [Puia sp.]|jgi:hypothetical protein|uniref:hypothetical protein n=1 Tax=Puia sp. TaxID=2045100 RepID=UPI002F41CFA1